MSQYYYRIFGVNFGPISLELLQQEIASGQLLGSHEVRTADETSWTPVADFVAQKLTHLNPVVQAENSDIRWDGGHDDIEIAKVANDNASTRPVGIWFCRGLRVGKGPYHFDDLLSFARRKELMADDELSLTEHGPWMPVRSVGRLIAEMPYTVTESVAPSLPPTIAVAAIASTWTAPVTTGQEPVISEQKTASTEKQTTIQSTETKTKWYVRMGHFEHGPIEFEKLIEMTRAGRILPMDFVRQSDQSDWTKAQAIPALFPPNSTSNQSDSTFSLKSVRPTFAVPHRVTQKAYSPHVVPIPTVTPAPIQDSTHPARPSTSPPPAEFTAQPPARSMTSAPLPVRTSQTPIDNSDRPAESVRQANVIQTHRPISEPAARDVDGHQSSKQPINDPPHKVNGESKHKLRRGQFKEPQLIDGKNLIMAAGVVLALLFAWRSLMTASIGDFELPYSELGAIYRTLDEKRSENPTMELWAFARKEVVYKIESVKQKIKNLNSRHPVRNILLSFGDSLVAAAKSETHEEVTMHMQDAFKFLIASTKEFRKWKDEEFQKEMKRKNRPKTITKEPERQ